MAGTDDKPFSTRRSGNVETVNYAGFGARADFGAHVFRVNIPPGRAGMVVLSEDYGYLAGDNGIPDREIRVEIERSKWTPLAEITRREFNPRLKAKKVPPSTWKPGDNLLDRLLGKELCVLMWAAELAATPEQLDTICAKWADLRPEERWWLYAMTAAEAGGVGDRDRGWRKALFSALSDGEVKDMPKARQRRIQEQQSLSLFDGL